MTTVIVDYESGNLHSAEKAFQRMASDAGAGTVLVTSDPETVRTATRIVLPGDGAFPACRKELYDHRGLFEAMKEAVIDKGRPFMGICIGMQMLATRGLEYTETDGFDWIAGTVGPVAPSDPSMKVPHMGWNDLVIDTPHPVLDGVSTGDHAYFVHSYHFEVADLAQRIAHVDYGGPVTAVVGRDNLVGTQFHPEKSQATGLRIIRNFLTWTP
ncbi:MULTISPECIES: imidazole glycerol phosphate synthase subunit HisH [Roseovarius]|uniref:imidazole glycerol phosphate synthase subunit HisH n=1 Tax=Roseovarius TaxID=74030 RepID=UPI001C97F34E|nr:imidazole glycerol phosphate synthase subunit HisH [Roseovarius atlanticus]MBY5988038.1 imidazole glycerol phosphate synthase subunit HisH [Roseovarius atlanticus]MBY6123429.1 imidazole glycerol phosphate synthase subunit HisH [Roseovarius atlanticus]MBY6147924.1 imidazole glycerol phosphate synthase subunit HisH [Roseovarius atlanticus]